MAVAPSVAQARVLVVDDDAGCADARYSTIQSAVDAAAPGDDIRVCAGTYREQVAVPTDRLTIVSRTLHAAVIQPPADTQNAPTILNLSARGTLLRGFTIRGVQPGGDCGRSGDGIVTFGPATIDFNRIADSACHTIQRGIVLDPIYPGQITVAHNEILDVGSSAESQAAGIFSMGGTPSIHSNVIRGTEAASDPVLFQGIGIDLNFGGSGKVQDNTIEDNTGTGIDSNGLEVEGFNLSISGNRVRRNGGNGIEVQQAGTGIESTAGLGLRVVGNGVFDNAGDGIRDEDNNVPGLFAQNRSLGNGGFDCFRSGSLTTWKDNVGVTDSPPTLCRAP